MARSRALANLQPAIDGVAIGQTTPAAVAATTLAASGAVSGAGFTNLLASPPAIGGTAAAAVTATALTATGTTILGGDRIIRQTAPVSYGVATTLTAADIQGGLIQYTGAAANLTLPTGTALDTLFTTLANDRAVEFTIINTGSGAATVTANTGVTIVGTAAVSQQNSSLWRLRRTGTATYVAYRLAG